MSYGYSLDLRKSVLSYIEDGHSAKEASEIFGVTRQTIYNWISLKKKTGNLKMKRTGQRKSSKFDEGTLRKHMLEHNDAYLDEIGSCFGGSASGAYRALKRFKITRKKSRFSTKNDKKSDDKSLLRL